MLHLARTLFRHRSALSVLSTVSLKTTVATTRLGALWWVLDPLVMMWIYYFMVRVVFDRGGEDYHLFVLIGIVSWQFFSKTVLLTAMTLERNRRVLASIRAPLEMFLVVPALIQALFALIGYAIILVWHGALPSAEVAWLPAIMFVVGCFGVAVGGLMAIWVVYLPDVGKFLDYGLRIGFFITPVLYPASMIAETARVPELLKDTLCLNPMLWAITQVRGVILYDGSVDPLGLLAWAVGGLAVLQASMVVFRINRRDVKKHLLRD